MRIRPLVAFLVVAAAWGASLYLHQRTVVVHHRATTETVFGTQVTWPASTASQHPSWADPAALALAIGSVGVGLTLLLPLRRA